MHKVLILMFIAIAICLFFIAGAVAVRAETFVVNIKDLDSQELAVQGFELSDRTQVEISAVGAGLKQSSNLFSYGWIIDADSRETVWSMQDDCHDLERLSSVLVECKDNVRLGPGKYEAYFYVGDPNRFMSIKGINDLGDLIDIVGIIVSGDNDDEDRFYKEDIEELFMTVSAGDGARSYTPEYTEPAGSIVYFNRPERDEYHHQGFTLKEKVDLKIYAIGEYSESYDVFVDGGWIVDADSRKKVWSMDKWNTERAGGADKNRCFRDVITLGPGNYIAYYATDDSHDYGEFNSPPPSDPKNYGMSIALADPSQAQYVADFDENLNETEIVSLTRIRDDAFERTGFSLKKDAQIHIIALGERGYGRDNLVDYGWIVNVDDLEKVWEMTVDNTGHAGGAAKNCRFDGIIELPAGNYMVYYRSDDSHSYGDWNATPPYDKRAWGISLYGVGKGFDKSSFELADKFEPSGNILVDMTGLGDDEDIHRTFTLDQTTEVRIVALGEGMKNEMYDYGWIENDNTGEVVWEMTYRKTRHAGGADKNRMTVANITLPKGTYRAEFVTDGSHSLEDFNASPPDNPERWGMIISKK